MDRLGKKITQEVLPGSTAEAIAAERRRRNRESVDTDELIARLADGDQNAWGEMVLRFNDSIVAFLTSILHSREAALDVAQDALASTWENREKLREVVNLKAYFYRLSKNHAFNYIRKQSRAGSYSGEMPQDPLAADYGAHEILIGRETEELLWIALQTMPEQRRRVFEMSRFEGKTNEEIASELGITRETVKQHIYRVNKELKETLLLVAILFVNH